MSKWSYKAKSQHNETHKDWKPCTEKEKLRIDSQHPNKFIFKENKQPKPTPSMTEKQKAAK